MSFQEVLKWWVVSLWSVIPRVCESGSGGREAGWETERREEVGETGDRRKTSRQRGIWEVPIFICIFICTLRKCPHAYPALLDDMTMPFLKEKDTGKVKTDFLPLPAYHFCIRKVPTVGTFFLQGLVCDSHVEINIYYCEISCFPENQEFVEMYFLNIGWCGKQESQLIITDADSRWFSFMSTLHKIKCLTSIAETNWDTFSHKIRGMGHLTLASLCHCVFLMSQDGCRSTSIPFSLQAGTVEIKGDFYLHISCVSGKLMQSQECPHLVAQPQVVWFFLDASEARKESD